MKQMVNKAETEQFLGDERPKTSGKCCSVWWNQGFPHQEAISRVIESYSFRALVIFLVVVDTALIIGEIMLDSYKIHHECKMNAHRSAKQPKKIEHGRIEIAMEMAHFTSIGILLFFVIELIVRIYSSGRDFWNIRKRKMEYFDAFIVTVSLAIDLYFLRVEKEILGEQLLLLFSFRLWRFVRIVSSVAEGVRNGQIKHKQNLNKQYIIAIRRLIGLMKYKTNFLSTNSDDFNAALEHFQKLDSKCQASLDALGKNHELTSSLMVARFIEELTGLDDGENSTIAAILVKPPVIGSDV